MSNIKLDGSYKLMKVVQIDDTITVDSDHPWYQKNYDALRDSVRHSLDYGNDELRYAQILSISVTREFEADEEYARIHILASLCLMTTGQKEYEIERQGIV